MKLYGTRETRTWRCEWVCEELGLEYEVIPQPWREARSNPEFLAINPNGRVPALVDDDLVLFESTAINLHLALKHADAGLWPDDLTAQSLALQWTIWAVTEVDNLMMALCWHRSFHDKPRRNPHAAAQIEQALQHPLHVLDQSLADRDYLTCDAFTIGDLNVHSIVYWVFRYGRAKIAHLPNISRWSDRIIERPAFLRARYERDYEY